MYQSILLNYLYYRILDLQIGFHSLVICLLLIAICVWLLDRIFNCCCLNGTSTVNMRTCSLLGMVLIQCGAWVRFSAGHGMHPFTFVLSAFYQRTCVRACVRVRVCVCSHVTVFFYISMEMQIGDSGSAFSNSAVRCHETDGGFLQLAEDCFSFLSSL